MLQCTAELRYIMGVLSSCGDNFLDRYTTEQLLQIGRMHMRSGWDFYPDNWSARQLREALKGKVPDWNDDESPKYEDIVEFN